MTAIVADIRNKLNGSVFSRNRYGAYVRTKVTPVNPQTAAQTNVRNRLSSNSQAWRGIGQPARDSWTNAAVNFPIRDIYGNSKILSGNALYVKLNNNLVNAGETALTNAPSPGLVGPVTIGVVAASAAGGTLSIIFTPATVAADTAIKVETTPNIAPGRSFVKNQFRQLGYIAASGTTPFAAGTLQVAKHGAMVQGDKIFTRLTMVNLLTGQMGIPVEQVSIVGA